jgi:uncharacterized protein (TIGR02757 family)
MRRGGNVSAGGPAGQDRGGKTPLARHLEGLYRRYHRVECLAPDPLLFLHRYERREDVEVAGLVAALLAYGRVEQILASVDRALGVLGSRPEEGVRRFDARSAAPALRGFVHRWSRGEDLAALFSGLRRVLERHASLEALFLEGYAAGEPGTVREALTRFVRSLRAAAPRGAALRPGVRFLLTDPVHGSACKRWNLFLRWMVRRDDALDRGVWRSVSPADLIVPLDIHVARLARELGLSARRTPDWRMAEEVTASLRRFDALDPTRFDFALCRAGMLESRGRGARPRLRRPPPSRRFREPRTRAEGTSR